MTSISIQEGVRFFLSFREKLKLSEMYVLALFTFSPRFLSIIKIKRAYNKSTVPLDLREGQKLEIYTRSRLTSRGLATAVWPWIRRSRTLRGCLVVWLGGPGSYLGNLVLGNLAKSMQYPTFGCMYELSLAHARWCLVACINAWCMSLKAIKFYYIFMWWCCNSL
jgi:hypothetical protein